MLRKLDSEKDIRQLGIGDVLVNQPDTDSAKSFTVENVSDGIVYAIHEKGFRLLKLILLTAALEENWWLIE